MSEYGKVDRAFFEEHIYPHLGADRDDVRLGPTHGADFGLVSVGDRVVALAADPVFVPLDLGVEAAAWYGFHVVVSDAALSGLPPAHLSLSLAFPGDLEASTFADVWSVFDREARDLGVSLTTGHTGRYAGASFPTIGGATCLAVGDPGDVVLPTGAEPGNRLLATKGPAVETAGVLAKRFGDDLDVPDAAVTAARERFYEMSVVPDAMAAAGTGRVTAMHDATEGGVANALLELAAASGVELAVERDRFPVGEGVREVCAAFDVDPWTASSEGTVLLAVEDGASEAVLDALADAGVRASEVGAVRPGTGALVDDDPVPEPVEDGFWPAYEAGLERYG